MARAVGELSGRGEESGPGDFRRSLARGSLDGGKQSLIFYFLKLRELDPSNYFKVFLKNFSLL